MTANTLHLPWGNELISIDLPEKWRIQGILEPSSLPPCANPHEEVLRALANPIGAPPLGSLARAGMKVAIVIDDGSRPTPVGQILPQVLAELEVAGGGGREQYAGPNRPVLAARVLGPVYAGRGTNSESHPLY